MLINNFKFIISACIPEKREVKELRRLTKVLMLFPDFHFQCDGYVSSVEFYAHESGTFYLSSWRQTGDDRHTLQAYNSITATRSGNQVGTSLTIQQDNVFFDNSRHKQIILVALILSSDIFGSFILKSLTD